MAEKRAKLRAALASGKPLDPEIANDKQLRKDFDYDASRDVAGDASLDIDDEYSELSGVVGRCVSRSSGKTRNKETDTSFYSS